MRQSLFPTSNNQKDLQNENNGILHDGDSSFNSRDNWLHRRIFLADNDGLNHRRMVPNAKRLRSNRSYGWGRNLSLDNI